MVRVRNVALGAKVENCKEAEKVENCKGEEGHARTNPNPNKAKSAKKFCCFCSTLHSRRVHFVCLQRLAIAAAHTDVLLPNLALASAARCLLAQLEVGANHRLILHAREAHN